MNWEVVEGMGQKVNELARYWSIITWLDRRVSGAF